MYGYYQINLDVFSILASVDKQQSASICSIRTLEYAC